MGGRRGGRRGRRAIEKWDENAPHVTVIDFALPEMDGLEAARQLSLQHPGAPILMVTIDPSQQLEQEAQKAGVKGLFAKADVKSIFARSQRSSKVRLTFT